MGSMLVDGGPFTNTGASYFGSAAQASITAAGVHVGDGSGLTNLTVYGSNIVSGGVLPNGLLSTNSPVNGGFLQETGDKRKLTFDGGSLTNLTGGKITGPITNLSNTTLGSAGQTIIDASGNYTSSGSLLAVGGLSGTGGAITNGVLRNTGGTHYLTNDANGFAIDNPPQAGYKLVASGGAIIANNYNQFSSSQNQFYRTKIQATAAYTSSDPLLYVQAVAGQTVPAFGVDQTNGTKAFYVSATNGDTTVYGNLFVGTSLIITNSVSFLAADATTISATLANTLLSIPVTLGHKYIVECQLFLSDSTSVDGAKIDFGGGSAAATNFRVQVTAFDTALNLSTQLTSLTGTATASTFTGNGAFECHGSLEPSSSGTFIVRFAQSAHTTGTLTLARGSYLKVFEAP